MPEASRGHAAHPFQFAQPSKMEEATRGPRRLLEEPITEESETGSFASDDTAIAIDNPGAGKLDKQSLDYVLRSGVAGGLAGCAVGRPFN